MIISRFSKALLLASLPLLLPFLAKAESIDNFKAIIKVGSDAKLQVSEAIAYDFGDQERHGLFRDITAKYRNDYGRFRLRVSDVAVSGYQYITAWSGDDFRVKIGDPNQTINGKHEYLIAYSVRKAISRFDSYDEIYWNVTGNNWDVPISSAEALLVLPEPVGLSDLKIACYAGLSGSSDRCLQFEPIFDQNDDKIVAVNFKQLALDPREGLTISVAWPKGLVVKDSAWQLVTDFLSDNWILSFPLIAAFILFFFWRRYGRDAKGRGTVIPEYEIPSGLSPSEAGAIVDASVSNRELASEIIFLAVKGYLKIERLEKQGVFGKADFELLKLKEADEQLLPAQKFLMDKLFSGREAIKLSGLSQKFSADWNKLRDKVYEAVTNASYFGHSPQKVRQRFIVAAVGSFVICVWLAGYFGSAAIASGSLLAGVFGLFAYLMPALTEKGALAKEKVLGFKLYLEVAEKDRLDFHNSPEKAIERFEACLPYAIALGVEKKWAAKFEGLYQSPPNWYGGSNLATFSALALVNDLDSFQAVAATNLSSAPSGGSGSGGGGFSGGGFGGGGGGSW